MTTTSSADGRSRKPLRLWPGVVILVLQWVVRFLVPAVWPDLMVYGLMGGAVGGLAIVLWWVFFSRAPWVERLGGAALMIAAIFLTKRLVHVSIATGAMGMLVYMLALPIVSLVFVAWAASTRKLTDPLRRATMVVSILLGCGVLTLIQTGGFTGDFHNDFRWRWAKTPEDQLIAQSTELQAAPPLKEAIEKPAQIKATVAPVIVPPAVTETTSIWPGFRGPHRNGTVPGVRIKTEWTASPPVALWRRPVGPGWSSFAVRGNLVYTQEQRGPDEVVACYKLTTGEPVWAHRDKARFWESNAGAGPRGTPTLNKGRVYTLGGTGLLNALNAGDGSVVWSRNAAADAGMKVPEWGFAGSPLVVGDAVIAAVSGRLASYDIATGAPRWQGPRRGVSYSSPQLLNIEGVEQILLVSQPGAVSIGLGDGKVLWEHPWKGYPIVQPGITAEGDILISVKDGGGTRRLNVTHGNGGWKAEERWTSSGLKPYFNDFVVHNGHAYGFDGNILACIDLNDGKRKWKGGRYGNGQLVLLPNQNLLLVLSEEGGLALVRATPDSFSEAARFPGIEGKTWNHPVLAGDVLLVRNGEEMAAFRLALESQ